MAPKNSNSLFLFYFISLFNSAQTCCAATMNIGMTFIAFIIAKWLTLEKKAGPKAHVAAFVAEENGSPLY